MTRGEHRGILLGAAVALAATAIAAPARAGEVQDSYDRLNKAYSDYYKGVRSLGRDPSQQQKDEVAKKVLVPAQVDFGNAVGKKISTTEQDARRKSFDYLKAKLLGAILPKWILHPGEKGKETAASGKGSSTAPIKPTVPAQHKEDVILDGSNIPKEIEFPGGKSQ
jgi:gas vesicle protein